MSDLIDRQAAIDALGDGAMVNYQAAGHDNGLVKAIDVIKGLPHAQPEIIRCKDCLMHGVCRFEQGLGLDGYCSQAERRSDDEQRSSYLADKHYS